MGRKRISKDERKKVISVGLKQKTVDQIDSVADNRSLFLQKAAEEKLEKDKKEEN